MPDSGSGTGTAIIPALCPATPPWTIDDLPECQAISLARYCEILGIDECGFWGVYYTGQPTSCRSIWVKYERDMIRRQLLEAQEEIEQITRYPLTACWIQNEKHPYKFPMLTRWVKVIQAGIPAISYIDDDAVVDHSTDPAIVGPIATTITDPDEVKVYFAASLTNDMVEITPSRIVLTGGLLTIYIPRCRLVLPNLWNNTRQGIDYDDLTNFCDVVDVIRLYNDDSTNANLIWPHVSTAAGACGCPTCSEYNHDGCILIHDGNIGKIGVLPAAYSDGTWTRSLSSCVGTPDYVELNYQAGMVPTSKQAEDAVIRLAHAKMPEEPCACEVVTYHWSRDRNVPGILTRERINCPFGLSDGAWTAWRFANSLKSVRGGVL